MSSGIFAIGIVSGKKLGSCYNSNVVLKTALVFVVANLIALSLSFILGNLLTPVLKDVLPWIAFSFLFLIGVRLLLESVEKSPSLNYTDIVQNSYMIRVAVQSSVDYFFLGFVLALVSGGSLLLALFISAIFSFLAMTLGLSHGHSFAKTVLGNRLQRVAGVIVVIIAVKFLLTFNG
jgi:putative Mn2+ efflux pump MntP